MTKNIFKDFYDSIMTLKYALNGGNFYAEGVVDV